MPSPLAPRLETGPSSISTRWRTRCSIASSIGPLPLEAEVGPSRLNGQAGHGVRIDARPVDVQLLLADPVGRRPAGLAGQLRAENAR